MQQETEETIKQYFYPRPPGGGRHKAANAIVCHLYFYPRPPGGGRRASWRSLDSSRRFLSTPSGWRATDGFMDSLPSFLISIHALRVEGDRSRNKYVTCTTKISIHALRVEGDRAPCGGILMRPAFLSTPSGWRATASRSDTETRASAFLSTPSGWRATIIQNDLVFDIMISIHALRVEGDTAWTLKTSRNFNFYPRPPGGGRRGNATLWACSTAYFYPRPPGGGRHQANGDRKTERDFYPRPPGGGRPLYYLSNMLDMSFLSTPSGWRATCSRARLHG